MNATDFVVRVCRESRIILTNRSFRLFSFLVHWWFCGSYFYCIWNKKLNNIFKNNKLNRYSDFISEHTFLDKWHRYLNKISNKIYNIIFIATRQLSGNQALAYYWFYFINYTTHPHSFWINIIPFYTFKQCSIYTCDWNNQSHINLKVNEST